MMPLVCPFCRNKFDLEQAAQDVDGLKFVELVTSVSPLLIRPLFNYCKLFTPEKQAMNWTRALKVVKELAPMMREGKVKRNKVSYDTPVSVWLAALAYLNDTPPASLTLPLKGNGYLLTVLVAQSDKAKTMAADQQKADKQAEIDTANKNLEQAKQKQAERDEPPMRKPHAPMPENIKAALGNILNTERAHLATLTPEQKELRKQELLEQAKALQPQTSS